MKETASCRTNVILNFCTIIPVSVSFTGFYICSIEKVYVK